MIVRKAARSDVAEAAKILHESYFDSLAEAKKHLLTKMKQNEFFVALSKSKVIGLFAYSRHYSHYANYLCDIAVAKNSKRKGVGSLLLKKYIEVSKNEQPIKQKFVLSSTDANNEASVKMHLKAGFRIIGKIEKLHYGKDEIFFGYDLRKFKK